MDKNKENIPWHTRFGLRFLQLLLIVFSLLLVKRCVVLYQENKIQNEQLRIEYFDKGFASGMKKARGKQEDPEPLFNNYALKKAYRDGYRQGWDKGKKDGLRFED